MLTFTEKDPLMLPNFQTPSIFLGLFLRKIEVQDYQNFAESLPWRLPEFDAEPQLNPNPQNAPADVARVRFASKDGRLRLDVAPAKVHFQMMPGNVTRNEQGQTNVQTLPVDKAYENFTPQALRVHTTLSEHFGAAANRIGVVTDMIAPVQSSANQRIQNVVLGGKNYFGERIADVQIQALSKVSLDGDVNINRRVSVRALRTGAEGNPDLILNVNVDINTLAEEPYDVALGDLEKFLNGVSTHLQTKVPLLAESALFA